MDTNDISETDTTEDQATAEESTSGGEAGGPDELAALKAEIVKLTEEKEEMRGQLLRLAADHDNFRKRTIKEKAEFAKFANEKIIAELLPIVDSFEHAMIHLREDSEIATLKKGIELIYGEFKSTLAKFGLTRIEAQGKRFDPNFHEAMMRVSSLEYDDEIIVEDLRAGYLLNERLIRPSMVKVNKRPEVTAGTGGEEQPLLQIDEETVDES